MNKSPAKREKRSLNLIADFVDGYAKGWFFAVSESFKDCLDIKYMERKEPQDEGPSRSVMRWTQGQDFCFAEGHRIYDTPKAYLQWSEALKHIKFSIEVLRAIPAGWVDQNHRTEGAVTFKLEKPNSDCTGLETLGQYHMTQARFVEYLRTGELKG